MSVDEIERLVEEAERYKSKVNIYNSLENI
jgi:hypothetical protein